MAFANQTVSQIQRWRSLEIVQTSARATDNSTNSPGSRPRSNLSSLPEDAIRNAIRRENRQLPYYAEDWLDWEVEGVHRTIPRSHRINVALAMLLVGAAQAACIAQVCCIKDTLSQN
jgi:hypothetical protein